MSEREKILRYYRSSGDGDLAARLLDLAEGVLRNHKFKVSEFLDPHGLSIAETIAAHFPSLELLTDGGYHGAERVKAVFADQDFMGKADYGITAVSITWDPRYYRLSHRDVLGALMGLGLKREVFGDIIIGSQGCQVLIDNSLSKFVVENLPKVGAAPVEVKEVSPDEIAPREEKVKEIRTTVASLRLDVVAAAGFGTSRTKMASEIKADKLKLNWQEIKNSAQTVKAGDIISMRGRGRVEVCELLGQTKKERFSILLKRFM